MPKVPVHMPQLGESIAEAVVVEIGVQSGQEVDPDQEIFQVETNKAVMGVTPPCRGTLTEVLVEVDQSYPVGATLAFLEVSEEEARKAGLSGEPSPTAGESTPAEEPDTPTTEEESPVPADAPHFRINNQDEIDGGPQSVKPTLEGLPVPASTTGATYLSPRMKARMEELGLNAADMAGIAGSGAGGRVTVEDFEKFILELEKNKITAASPMRIAVADSMRRSWSRPLATVGIPVRLEATLAHRKKANPKPGIALYTIRALAVALAENTAVAGRLVGERIVHPKAIDIGFAVEVADGVLVPVLKDVDQKKLSELTSSYDQLVAKARERKLPPEARGAGIATVTNFGTFNIVWATPIPLPEQNLVLGLGAGRKKPVWSDEVQQFIPVMEAQLTLSFDHRILDGGAAGRLLHRIADLLQTPEEL